MPRIFDERGFPVSDSNPFPTEINSPLDAFGRVRTSAPVAIFDAGHQYELNRDVWDTDLSLFDGSVTHLPLESAVLLSTGGANSGNLAVLQSKVYHRYQPGKSQLVLATGVMGEPQINVRRRYGYFDDANGVFFEQTGEGLAVVIRSSTSGTPVDIRVPQAAWNVDRLDGTGFTGLDVDSTKNQIYAFDLEWLGAGRVRFGIVLGGEVVYCHEFRHINALTAPYMATANLPVRAEIENTGFVPDGATTFKQVCVTVISEGGQEDDRAFLRSAGNGKNLINVGVGGRPVLSLRPALLYNGLVNRGQVIPNEFKIYTSANIYYELVLGGTLTGAAFASAGARSIAEIDVAATAITGGQVLDGGYVATSGAGVVRGQGSNGILGRLPLVLNALGNASDHVTLVARTFTSTADVSAQATWREFR